MCVSQDHLDSRVTQYRREGHQIHARHGSPGCERVAQIIKPKTSHARRLQSAIERVIDLGDRSTGIILMGEQKRSWGTALLVKSKDAHLLIVVGQELDLADRDVALVNPILPKAIPSS